MANEHPPHLEAAIPSAARPTRLARFRGCLLGHAIGDALGAPYEWLSTDLIYRTIGDPIDLVSNPPVDELRYTDDTEMAIALAASLLERGEIDEAHLSRSFVEHFTPERGYGTSVRTLVRMMATGDDWRSERHTIFPGGSYGNGCAMRVPPLALAFAGDVPTLLEQAQRSAELTHTHPLAIEGTQLLALAIARLMRAPFFHNGALFDELLAHAHQEEYRSRLIAASSLAPGESVRYLGCGMAAHESVVTAIACFAQHPDDYSAVVARAIELGGDTDTIAAMAGAVSGAYLGISAIPQHLIEMLEEGERGRGHIDRLAHQLHDRFRSAP